MRRAFSRAIVAATLLLLSGLAWAQVSLVVEPARPVKAWVGGIQPGAVPKDALSSDKAKIELPTGKANADETVYVLDVESGNLASRPVAKVGKEWKLLASDFNRIHELRIRVTWQDKAVAAGSVEVETAKAKQVVILTPSDSGTVSLFGVPLGEATMSVRTRYQGKEVVSPKVVQTLAQDRETAIPSITVAMNEAVDVVSEPKLRSLDRGQEDRAPAQPQPARPADTNPIGRLVVFLLGLVAIGGLIYGLIRFVQTKPEKIDEQLAKVGVQIPKDPTADDAPATPFTPAAPAPVQQIVLDNAAPVAPVGIAPVGDPRFVLDDGSALILPEGTHVVSREGDGVLVLHGEGTVSRLHAEVQRNGSLLTVRDLGSTNGTFVNGTRITDETPLRPGDRVQFGAVAFRVEA